MIVLVCVGMDTCVQTTYVQFVRVQVRVCTPICTLICVCVCVRPFIVVQLSFLGLLSS